MRILCDQHVNHKYVHALQETDGITVTTVRHIMSADAPDIDLLSPLKGLAFASLPL